MSHRIPKKIPASIVARMIHGRHITAKLKNAAATSSEMTVAFQPGIMLMPLRRFVQIA